jgi:hypothetical protein
MRWRGDACTSPRRHASIHIPEGPTHCVRSRGVRIELGGGSGAGPMLKI